MDIDFADCRDLGHAWFPPRDEPHIRRGVGITIRVVRCNRSCKTRREEYIDSRGVVTKRSYQYPEGYLNKGQRILKSEARVVALRAARAAMRARKVS